MVFLLGVRRYDLGDVHDTIAVMGRIISLCWEGQIEEARDMAEATKQHIVELDDLSRRPYMPVLMAEVIGIVERAERKGTSL